MTTHAPAEPYSLECTINGSKERIRFSPYSIASERMAYDIEQEYGLNADGEFSQDFQAFEAGSIEQLIIETIRSGNIKLLTDAGLILCERPTKGNISRNLPVFNPETGILYTIGGIGLIAPTDDHRHFILKDPLVGQEYGAYQEKRGNPVGGTQYVTEEGFKPSINKSTVGTLEYKTGLYHAIRKALENESLKSKGLNCPTFIAAGPIKNLEEGKFGFTVYKSHLTPEYLMNISMFINKSGAFKPAYETYLQSKYSQLYSMHHNIGENHGQPSIGNTLPEIDIFSKENNISCQVKDFETNMPIPENTKQIIEDGLAPVAIGYHCTKSPHVAAMICDLQISIQQELNVLYLPSTSIQNPQQKFNYLTNQCGQILNAISQIYSLSTPEQAHDAINFAMQRFHENLTETQSFAHYNEVIAGAFVHKWMANSDRYSDQITIRKD